MEYKQINPWNWQNQFSFSQGIEVSGSSRILYCAGQTSVDEEGRPVHIGNMRDQVELAFANLESVLLAANYSLGDVTRLNYYTTDVDSFFDAYEVVAKRLAEAGCQPASTLLGVARLAFPELLVEIEATAAK
jgi:enamine deaminase RidA (YjgF/YER057c/UK114 family)